MAYDQNRYKALRSLGFTKVEAVRLADDSINLSDTLTQQAAIADLAGGATLPDTVTKVNAILAALRSAGVIST